MAHFTRLKRHSARSGELLALVSLLVLAAVLRFYKLDAQSLWYDEGNSARIAERSVQLIIEGAAGDIHPPLYYLILKFWRGLFGSSELELRSLSAACGVLLVLFTFLMGRAWCNARVGLIAALLVGISPFGIYYSQETRMYALLAVWAAMSTWALMRMERLEIGDWRLGIGACYVFATAAGLYTQYAYPFVMVAQGVCVLLWLGTKVKVPGTLRALTQYVIANVIAIALYAPWLPIAIRQIRGWVVAQQEYELGSAVVDALRWLVVGRTLPLSEAMLPMLVFGAFVVMGLLFTRRSEETKAEPSSFLRFFVLFLLAFLPLALLFAFKLYRDAYLKFLLVCLAPLCLLVANGMDAIGQRAKAKRQNIVAISVAAFCFLPLAFLLWPSLNNLYNNPAYARDDYRGIAKLIREGEREDDAVLLIAPNQWEVFTYYYPNLNKTFAPKYQPANRDEVEAELRKATAGKQRLFVLYFAEREADPNGWYEHWLATNAFKAEERWVGNIRLAVYAAPIPVAGVGSEAVFGGQIELTGFAGATHMVGPVRPGDIAPLALWWHTRTKLEARYKVFVHIGKPDAPPIAQNDGEPVAGFRPSTSWSTDEMVTDYRAVWIKPGTPPGQYAIFVGLYDANTSERLKLQDGSDRFKIGEVAIADK